MAVAEEGYLGGTCVNVGCIPKKLFVLASHVSEQYEDARGFGWSRVDAGFCWSTLRDNKNAEISRLNSIYQRLLEDAGVRLFLGHAQLLDGHRVQIGDESVTAEKILIATGSWPWTPDFPGAEHAVTSNEAFHLTSFPERVVIIGGGYIAVEFAAIFNGLGANTDLVYRGPLFLRGFDDDLRHFVADEVRKKGVALHFDEHLQRIEKNPDASLKVCLTSGRILHTDLVLCATGRKPSTRHLGLEKVRVKLNHQGAIQVDDWFQTDEPSVFALGDVIDRVQLTPVAIQEAMAFVQTQFLGQPTRVDYQSIPTAVFCHPELGTVGMTEAEARRAGHSVDVYRSEFRQLKHSLSDSSERTLMKILVDRSSDLVLGVHMVGGNAGEIIQGMAVALKAGATKSVFDATCAVHPTSAEEFVTMRSPVAS